MTKTKRRITQKALTVHCAKCDHEWHAFMPLPLPINRAVKVMRGIVAAGCPECGAFGKDVLCGPLRPSPDSEF